VFVLLRNFVYSIFPTLIGTNIVLSPAIGELAALCARRSPVTPDYFPKNIFSFINVLCLASDYCFAASPPEHSHEKERTPPLYVRLSEVRLDRFELFEEIRILFEWRGHSRLAPINYKVNQSYGFRIGSSTEHLSNILH